MARWMIYGANGYTGRLCAEHAVELGESPILAGRSVSAVAPLAMTLGLEHRVVGLGEPDALAEALAGVDLVLHCAGPFSETSRPMLKACMRAGAHYLDITGEIAVFEGLFARAPELLRAGVCGISGVGFDVVPTDGLAALLGDALPDATHLELAFVGLGGGVSQGTAKTAVRGLGIGSAARIGGRIKKVPAAWKTKEVPLGGKPRHVVSIPWGDVSTAYHTTGIPNIVTYMALPKNVVPWMRMLDRTGSLMSAAPIQAALEKLVEARISGPSAEERASGASFIWGRAEAADGRWVEGSVTTPEGYRFTALSAVAAVQKVRTGAVPPGPWTPSRALGVDFLASIPGVTVDPLRHGDATGAAPAA